jgi:peptide/nickel transport system ATP-binding protein
MLSGRTTPFAVCSPAMPTLLEVDRLRVRFRSLGALRALIAGVRDPFIDAVLDVSLAVAVGEVFALVGESGSGKTTLARSILGLIRPSAGEIRFRGRALTGLSDRALKPFRREIALMAQDPVAGLSPRLTVRALVTEPLRIHGFSDGRDRDAEARRLLALVGLPERLLGAYPHQLSGGQARRVGVARALALDPALIIADEPTAGLDVSVQGEVLNLLASLRDRLSLAYLIVTHNLPVVRHVSDRMAIMYLGRLVELGPTTVILARPAHPYTAALLEAVPQPDPARRRTRLELAGEIPSLRNRPSGCEFHTRCRFAVARCRAEPPALRPGADGRSVACHFPLA